MVLTLVEKQFIKTVRDKCVKHNIFFLSKNTVKLKVNGINVGGYFNEEANGDFKGTLATALKCPDYMDILVHEFSHMEQYIEKTNIWKGANQCGPMDDWLLGKDVKNIEERIDQVKWLELDCEKRTVKNMIKYNLPVNISSYIQKANSYILFYNYIKETRLWCKIGNSPDEKSNKSLWSLCPDKFMPRSYYKTIPKNIHNKFIELDI